MYNFKNIFFITNIFKISILTCFIFIPIFYPKQLISEFNDVSIKSEKNKSFLSNIKWEKINLEKKYEKIKWEKIEDSKYNMIQNNKVFKYKDS